VIPPSSLAEGTRIIAEDMKGDKIYKPQAGRQTIDNLRFFMTLCG
jgi:hypothetical protein